MDRNNKSVKSKPGHIVWMSASSDKELLTHVKKCKEFICNNSQLRIDKLPSELFHSLHHDLEHKLIVQIFSNEDLILKLNTIIENLSHKEIYYGQGNISKPGKVVFVYSGMGPQWWGMGKDLYNHYDVFKTVIDKCDSIIRKHAGWSLNEEMSKDKESSNISRTWLAQPANFAIQVGLTELWKHWGVVPDGVVGHSIGETTAFYIAGLHTFEEALLVNLHRGRIQDTLTGHGKMLVLGIDLVKAMSLIHGNKHVRIAAVNSHSSITLAGDETHLSKIYDTIPDDIFKKYLNVNIPYHGNCMLQIKAELEYELSVLNFGKTNEIELYTSTTGKKWKENMSPTQFWWQNTYETVYFKPVIEDILQNGYNVFVEIGPHKVLSMSIKEIAAHNSMSCHVFSSLNQGVNELVALQKNAFSISCSGVDVNWAKYNNDLSQANIAY